MAKKGIEEMISEIEIFIDNCKYKPLSSSMIIVPKDDLEQMLNELKLKLPNEIERCKKIMRNKEAILADARTRADSIITKSVAEANKLVDQSQIVELANIRANEILDMARSQADQIVNEANADANEIRLGSMYYTKDKLTEVSNYINATLEAEKTNYDNLIQSLQSNLDIVLNNTNEINGDIANMTGAAQQAAAPEEATQTASEENNTTVENEQDYNVYGKTEYSNDDEDDEDDDFDDDFLDD
jgi:ribosomal protein L12E/L44/L45/RPP1/RPP2/vacuolar-type H+-ATPase subunit H